MAEQLIRNEQVVGSIPTISSKTAVYAAVFLSFFTPFFTPILKMFVLYGNIYKKYEININILYLFEESVL